MLRKHAHFSNRNEISIWLMYEYRTGYRRENWNSMHGAKLDLIINFFYVVQKAEINLLIWLSLITWSFPISVDSKNVMFTLSPLFHFTYVSLNIFCNTWESSTPSCLWTREQGNGNKNIAPSKYKCWKMHFYGHFLNFLSPNKFTETDWETRKTV